MDSDRNHPYGEGRTSADPTETDCEELIASAREYFSADFSNPSRTGCSTPEFLQELIRSRELPRQELRSHLLGCSECFSFYVCTARLA
jgi:hypothetical protein